MDSAPMTKDSDPLMHIKDADHLMDSHIMDSDPLMDPHIMDSDPLIRPIDHGL